MEAQVKVFFAEARIPICNFNSTLSFEYYYCVSANSLLVFEVQRTSSAYLANKIMQK